MISFTEHWDAGMLVHLSTLQHSPVSSRAADIILERNCAVDVAYELKSGRLYAVRESVPADKKGEEPTLLPVLQSVPGWARRMVVYGRYHDLDMQNARPCMQLALSTRLEVPCPMLKAYVSGRDKILQQICTKASVDRDGAKKLVLIAINGCGCAPELPKGVRQLLALLRDEAVALERALVESDEEWIADICDEFRQAMRKRKAGDDGKPQNDTAALLSRVYCFMENEALAVIQTTLQEHGWVTGALMFDGLLVERRADANLSDVIPLVNAALANVGVTVVEKSTEPTASDLEKLAGPFLPDNPGAYFRRMLMGGGGARRWYRMAGKVYAPHARVPGGSEYVGALPDAVNTVMVTDKLWQRKGKMDDVVKWATTTQTPPLLWPLLKPTDLQQLVCNFADGWYDMRTNEFHPLNNEPVPRGSVTFDKNYQEMCQLPTPKFEQLFKTQIYARMWFPGDEQSAEELENYHWYLAMFAVLLYPVLSCDRSRRIPFLEGPSNTGKSVMINLLNVFFPGRVCAPSVKSRQDGFGLKAMFDARVVLVPDAGPGLEKVIPRTILTSMSSGDHVEVPLHYNQQTESLRWTTPIGLAGNKVSDLWNDDGGSLAERFECIPFNTVIDEDKRDLSLEKTILEVEAPAIFLKMCAEIVALRAKIGDRSWKTFRPAGVAAKQEAFSQKLSSLDHFLQNGSTRRMLRHAAAGVSVTVDEVRRAYDNYVQFDLKNRGHTQWARGDNSCLQRAGYSVAETNLCKTCGNRCSREACGAHYDPRNRKKVLAVLGAELVDVLDVLIGVPVADDVTGGGPIV